MSTTEKQALLFLPDDPGRSEATRNIVQQLQDFRFSRDNILITADSSEFLSGLDRKHLALIIVDHNQLHDTEYDLLQVLCKQNENVPKIVVSDPIGEEKAIDLLKSGITDLVLWTNIRRLKTAVRRALENAEELHEVRSRMRLVEKLLDVCPSPLFYKNADGIYLECNSAFAGLMGVPREKIIGLQAADFMEPELLRFVETTDREVLHTGETRRREYALRDEEGNLRDFLYHKAAVYDTDRSVNGTVGVMLEVTDTKRNARKLRNSLELQEAAFNSIDDVIIAVDASDRTIRLVNPAVRTVFGYGPDEVIGHGTDILHVDREHHTRFAEEWNPVLENEGHFRTEFPMKRRDGTVFTAEITVTEINREYGWRAGVISLIRDISEIKRTEVQLRDNQREIEMILGNTPDAMVRIDGDRRIQFANRAVRDWTDVDPDRLIGLTIDAAFKLASIPDETRRNWNRDIAEVFETGREVERTRNAEVLGQEIWVDSRFLPEYDSEGNVVSVLTISRDMTEQKKTQTQLAQKEEQLRQAQRLESIGRLAGGIAHDFNNILTAIGGYLHLAMDAIKDNDSARTAIENIRAGSNRAARLTQQLLLFSRKAPSRNEYFDLTTVVGNMLKMLNRLMSEDITIVHEPAGTDAWLFGDEGKIEQVIMNLIINARDALPDGGLITVSSGISEDEESVVLEVADNGIGMAPDTTDKVFEPFFTTKTKGTGTGLGLAVVYGIVQEHSGTIDVESIPDKGTTVTVQFPRAAVEKPAGRRERNVSTPKIPPGKRILLIEDEPDIVQVVTAGLTQAGFTVESAGTLTTAYRKWREATEPFDVVLADVVLPDGSGISLLDLFAPIGDSRFVFVSGYLEDKAEFEMLRSGGFRFLHKPYSISALQEVLADELSRSVR